MKYGGIYRIKKKGTYTFWGKMIKKTKILPNLYPINTKIAYFPAEAYKNIKENRKEKKQNP